MSSAVRDEFPWDLAAEAITVRIRWFGLCVGYVLVNFTSPEATRPVLNAILTLGAVYAVIDTWFSYRGQVFLRQWPLYIALLEAVFIGLLCHFDFGPSSAFRFYYFLSLLVFAIRYAPWLTYSACVLHALSYSAVVLTRPPDDGGMLAGWLLMLVLMGWVTWAGTALAGMLKSASHRLAQLNHELQQNQALLEERISERTRELQQSQALLVQQEKQAAFGLLAAGIAHEVGNPLAAISSLVQMLKRRDIDEHTRERLGMVDDQLRRIQRTLRELVDFSRPATTRESLCDIHEVLDAAVNIAKYYKRKKGKTVITHYAEGLPCVRLVRDPLVQVFLNLILNAMDATPEGGTIELRTSLEDGWLRVEVRDNGHGIPPEHRGRMFQPYFTTKDTGTGLGLFVCRNIMEQTGGLIELTETSERGTAFTVYVNCLTAEELSVVSCQLSVVDGRDLPSLQLTTDH